MGLPTVIKRFLASILVLASVVSAHAYWQSRTQISIAAPAGYAGPGDVVSGASIWYGLRGYTAAYSTGSNPSVDLVDQAGANPVTINILSNGTLDVASVATWVLVNTVTTIRIKKLYDQTGNGKHVSQVTTATMPVLVLGPVTGLTATRPAMVFANSQFLESSVDPTISQPLTFSAVAIRTSGTSDTGIMAGSNGNDAEMILQAATVASIYAGSAIVSQTQTNNAWHSFHGLFDGASSVMNVDGSSGSTGNAGTGNLSSGHLIWIGRDSFAGSGSWWVGNINEAGVWPSALSGASMTSLSTNQHSYWGY